LHQPQAERFDQPIQRCGRKIGLAGAEVGEPPRVNRPSLVYPIAKGLPLERLTPS
jgi:hypothetical protein